MNKNINIFIEGIVSGEEESRITTKASGYYRLLDNVHLIKYRESAVIKDEISDPTGGDTLGADRDGLNTIKISSKMVEMIKSGENSTHMIFDLDRYTQSVYDTPYGSLHFKIQTTKIEVEERDMQITLHMEYSLFHEDSHISDNRIYINIKEAD